MKHIFIIFRDTREKHGPDRAKVMYNSYVAIAASYVLFLRTLHLKLLTTWKMRNIHHVKSKFCLSAVSVSSPNKGK